MPEPSPWQVWIDTGGTFTDCLARDPQGRLRRAKVLSSSALRGTVVEALDPRSVRVREDWGAPAGLVRGFAFRVLGAGGAVPVDEYDPAEGVMRLAEPIPEPAPGAAFEVRSPEE
ncbi:MAG TPA: hydantoinase/oxoprolinase N-terminal domain-containing protein, partial [Longimicrobiaceae bacterium]|nr:hydantoinase/oxoprolinase N-terminal domain-containing protein [Longimicrobiaceae bacterium]